MRCTDAVLVPSPAQSPALGIRFVLPDSQQNSIRAAAQCMVLKTSQKAVHFPECWNLRFRNGCTEMFPPHSGVFYTVLRWCTVRARHNFHGLVEIAVSQEKYHKRHLFCRSGPTHD